MAPHDLASLRNGLALGTPVVRLVWGRMVHSKKMEHYVTVAQIPGSFSVIPLHLWL